MNAETQKRIDELKTYIRGRESRMRIIKEEISEVQAEIDRLTAEDAACGCKCGGGWPRGETAGIGMLMKILRDTFESKELADDMRKLGEDLGEMLADELSDDDPAPAADLTKDEQIVYLHGVIDGMERMMGGIK